MGRGSDGLSETVMNVKGGRVEPLVDPSEFVSMHWLRQIALSPLLLKSVELRWTSPWSILPGIAHGAKASPSLAGTLSVPRPAQKLSLALFTGEDVGARRSLHPLC